MTNSKLKINLFGEAWKIKQIRIPELLLEQFKSVAAKMKQPLIEAISDPFFYYYLKNPKIQSIDDLEGITIEGLSNSPKNQIEIWYKNKKVQKLQINHLLEELLLFPLYNTSVINTDFGTKEGIYLEQKEIGLIGSFEIFTDNFNIDNLEFNLIQINEKLLLQKMKYNNHELTCKKKDTLINFQQCFEIPSD